MCVSFYVFFFGVEHAFGDLEDRWLLSFFPFPFLFFHLCSHYRKLLTCL